MRPVHIAIVATVTAAALNFCRSWRHAAQDMSLRNQAVFQRRGVLRQYTSAAGWLDAGEAAAINAVADAVRGGAILDIGVGGGRTASLLRAISDDYRGIDYVEAMVGLARRNVPDSQFAVMDARHLDYPDASFSLVVFSYNGIDCVSLADRQAILRQVHRVLRPGGYFVFSTLNKHGAEWSAAWPDWRVYRGTGKHPLSMLRATAKLLVGGINHLRNVVERQDWGALAIGELSAHNFALLAVFAALPEHVRQLQSTGFEVCAVYDPQGHALALPAEDTSTAPWFHIVARKPGAATAMAAATLIDIVHPLYLKGRSDAGACCCHRCDLLRPGADPDHQGLGPGRQSIRSCKIAGHDAG